ncbi:MAG: shikimate dehydrogenase [Deltaproteobacteria bacterium]|nr:shikimate dehydrogenase [Deltaproteobacteria bacterium]
MLVRILGWPLESTLSPAIHAAAFRACDFPWEYAARPTPPDMLRQEIARLRDADCRGANITIPHKEAVLGLVDDVDASAREIGAANCVVHEGRKLIAYNTDAEGFARALAEVEFDPHDKHAVILGAGGAARAVARVLARAGADPITVVNRSAPRADAIAALFGITATMNFDAALRGAELVVNATPIGWKGDAFDALPLELLSRSALVVDLVYRSTALIEMARAGGLRTQDGLPMLVHQAALSFELWTKRAAPLEVMREAALAAR